jgi:hypothetical protein
VDCVFTGSTATVAQQLGGERRGPRRRRHRVRRIVDEPACGLPGEYVKAVADFPPRV